VREDGRHARRSVMIGIRAASHGGPPWGTRTPHRCRSGAPAGRPVVGVVVPIGVAAPGAWSWASPSKRFCPVSRADRMS
jgi:hypothetical protein